MKKIEISLSLIIAVYNEIELVKEKIEYCLDVLNRDFETFELILVDDGSKDGTAEFLEEFGKTDPRVKVMHNYVNLNQGASIQRGYAVASCEYATHNAIDFPLAIEDTSKLMRELDGCDVLIVERKYSAGYTLWRHITSKGNRFLRKITFPILSNKISDMNFVQFYRTSILKDILPMAKSPTFTTTEMVFRAKKLNYSIKSMEVDYQPRTMGTPSFGKPHDIVWTLYDMMRYKLSVLFGS